MIQIEPVTRGTVDVSGDSRREKPPGRTLPGVICQSSEGSIRCSNKLARRRSRMDNVLRNGICGSRENSRRQFLRGVATSGVWLVAAASLPASAEEKAGLPAV